MQIHVTVRDCHNFFLSISKTDPPIFIYNILDTKILKFVKSACKTMNLVDHKLILKLMFVTTHPRGDFLKWPIYRDVKLDRVWFLASLS